MQISSHNENSSRRQNISKLMHWKCCLFLVTTTFSCNMLIFMMTISFNFNSFTTLRYDTMLNKRRFGLLAEKHTNRGVEFEIFESGSIIASLCMHWNRFKFIGNLSICLKRKIICYSFFLRLFKLLWVLYLL